MWASPYLHHEGPVQLFSTPEYYGGCQEVGKTFQSGQKTKQETSKVHGGNIAEALAAQSHERRAYPIWFLLTSRSDQTLPVHEDIVNEGAYKKRRHQKWFLWSVEAGVRLAATDGTWGRPLPKISKDRSRRHSLHRLRRSLHHQVRRQRTPTDAWDSINARPVLRPQRHRAVPLHPILRGHARSHDSREDLQSLAGGLGTSHELSWAGKSEADRLHLATVQVEFDCDCELVRITPQRLR